jgi:hypothetical protein
MADSDCALSHDAHIASLIVEHGLATADLYFAGFPGNLRAKSV